MKRMLLFSVLLVSLLQGVNSLDGGKIAELKRALGFVNEDKPLAVPASVASASSSSAASSNGGHQGIILGKMRNVLRKLRNLEGDEYYTVYFTVPREEIFKKRILAMVGNGLKHKRFKENIGEKYQKPLLNYLALVSSGVPIRAYFRPGKLISARRKLLREKEKFGEFTQLNKNDFDVINEYNPVALDEVIKLANDNVVDGFGGQMLVQLSIPKYMADDVLEAFTGEGQIPIDVIMQKDDGHEGRLRNSYALVYLQPDTNYREMRVILNDLMDKTAKDRLWDKMNTLAINLVDQIVDNTNRELPPPPIARDTPQIAPVPLPRDVLPLSVRRLPAVPRSRVQVGQLPPPIARDALQIAPAPLPRDVKVVGRRLPAVPRSRVQVGQLPPPPIARDAPQIAPAPLSRDVKAVGRRLPAVPRSRVRVGQLPPPPIARDAPQVAPAPLPRDVKVVGRRLPAVPRSRVRVGQLPPPPIARDAPQVVDNALPGQPGFADLLQAGLRKQAGGPSTAAAMGTNYDNDGLLVWTINNLTNDAVELTNKKGKTIYVEPGTTKTLSHKEGFKLDYFWEGPPASKVGEEYKVEGTMFPRKHVIDFGWNPRTGLVIDAHDIR